MTDRATSTRPRSAALAWLERGAWVIGIALVLGSVLIGWAMPALADSGHESVESAPRIDAVPDTPGDIALADRSTPVAAQPSPLDDIDSPGADGLSDWAPTRIASMLRAKARSVLPEPIAHVHVPSIGVTAPIYDGTDRLRLDLGIGLIEGTAPVGVRGNVGLAGHRDGHFRRLGELEIGDEVAVERGSRTYTYRVSDHWVVQPEDVWVLAPTTEASVTLVTCYPFRFLGNAPERYVVRAELVRVNDSL